MSDIYTAALLAHVNGRVPAYVWRELLELSLQDVVWRPTEVAAFRNLGYGAPSVTVDPVIAALRAGQLKLCSCPTCRQPLLPATGEYFFRDNRKRDGLYSMCKECHRKYDRVRRQRVRLVARIEAQKSSAYERAA